MKTTFKTLCGTTLAIAALAFPAMSANADVIGDLFGGNHNNNNNSYHSQSQKRQDDKNNWRNLATGAGAVALYGLLNHNSTATVLGAAGAAYSANRYEQDRKGQSQDNYWGRNNRNYYRNTDDNGYYRYNTNRNHDRRDDDDNDYRSNQNDYRWNNDRNDQGDYHWNGNRTDRRDR